MTRLALDSGNDEASAVAKVLARLVPFTIVLYLFNFLDRVNLSFAKFQMSGDLGFSESMYGFGASIFFIGYFMFEVPSNLMLQRVGARVWISRIVVSSGIASAAMAFVRGPAGFYTLRFLLGVAEAGFFSGMLLYYTNWVPKRHRARVGSVFLTSLALAGICGGPIAGMLLQINALGLVGWQWLFLLEGISTVLVGISVLVMLPNAPADSPWLTGNERNALRVALEAERGGLPANSDRIRDAFLTPLIWVLSIQYGLILFAFYVLGYWTPSIIKQVSHASDIAVGWLSAVPSVAGMAGMIAIGTFGDRIDRKGALVAVCSLMGAAGFAGCAMTISSVFVVACLSLTAVGIYGLLAPFWTIPPTLLRGSGMATAIAIINSVGNLGGGFVGPNVIGQLRERYLSYQPALFLGVGALVIVTVTSLCLQPPSSPWL